VGGNVLEIREAFFVARNALAVVFDAEKMATLFAAARDGDVAGGASMLFSTNSATALRGFCCESAMILMAFQSSPMRKRPEFFM